MDEVVQEGNTSPDVLVVIRCRLGDDDIDAAAAAFSLPKKNQEIDYRRRAKMMNDDADDRNAVRDSSNGVPNFLFFSFHHKKSRFISREKQIDHPGKKEREMTTGGGKKKKRSLAKRFKTFKRHKKKDRELKTKRKKERKKLNHKSKTQKKNIRIDFILFFFIKRSSKKKNTRNAYYSLPLKKTHFVFNASNRIKSESKLGAYHHLYICQKNKANRQGECESKNLKACERKIIIIIIISKNTKREKKKKKRLLTPIILSSSSLSS